MLLQHDAVTPQTPKNTIRVAVPNGVQGCRSYAEWKTRVEQATTPEEQQALGVMSAHESFCEVGEDDD